MAKNDFQYGGWNYYTLECGTIMALISPGDCTLHVALESWQWIHQVAAPCNVIRGSEMTCHWIHLVAAHCNVADGAGMKYRWICPNVRHIGILHLFSISTTSPQSTCYSAPVSKILSKSDHPRQKKWRSCRFSRWRISAILDFRDPIMGSLKIRITTY